MSTPTVIHTPADFIAAIGPAARASMAQTKIPASFTIAQAALESSWGAHCPGMNLFGIKADPSWHGPIVTELTHEEVSGKRIEITAKFRAYANWQGSIDDHAQFFIVNPRYKPAFACTTGPQWAVAVARAGYATDSRYAAKLQSIIASHNLQSFDKVQA